jgi:hypothetical protein
VWSSGGRQRVKPSECRDFLARDACPGAPFEVTGFHPCGGYAAHSLGRDEMLLSTGGRILCLQITHQIECVENFETHWYLFSVEEIVSDFYYRIYCNNIRVKNSLTVFHASV